MKTNVSQNSINTYRVISPLLQEQEKAVLMSMEIGKSYSRRQLGILAGIENSAAARTVNGLVKSGDLLEVGVMPCPITKRMVGAVSLSLADGA